MYVVENLSFFFFFLKSDTIMSRNKEFSLVDDSNEELKRKKMRALRYVNVQITLVALF